MYGYIKTVTSYRSFIRRGCCRSVNSGVLPLVNSYNTNGNDSSQAIWQNFSAAFGVLVISLYGTYDLFKNKTHNCGIVGVVGNGDDASGFLLEGLTILRNRGYDSAGIATVGSSNIKITKYASRESTADSIDLVRSNCSKHLGHTIGIAHTRWATHGGKTDQNAHPHTDNKERIALVHNGTINNSYDLKKELQGNFTYFHHYNIINLCHYI